MYLLELEHRYPPFVAGSSQSHVKKHARHRPLQQLCRGNISASDWLKDCTAATAPLHIYSEHSPCDSSVEDPLRRWTIALSNESRPQSHLSGGNTAENGESPVPASTRSPLAAVLSRRTRAARSQQQRASRNPRARRPHSNRTHARTHDARAEQDTPNRRAEHVS